MQDELGEMLKKIAQPRKQRERYDRYAAVGGAGAWVGTTNTFSNTMPANYVTASTVTPNG